MAPVHSLTVVAIALAASLGAASFAAASGVQEQRLTAVALAPIEHAEAALVIVGPAGETSYSPADLEALGAFGLTTKTPWRDHAAHFAGARLADLLARHGLAHVDAIKVTAENDYAVVIPRSVWEEHDVLLATRVDGHAHSRRARGPIQFVFDFDAEPAVGKKSFEQNWVWMASRIEEAN